MRFALGNLFFCTRKSLCSHLLNFRELNTFVQCIVNNVKDSKQLF